jgi:RNA polymerase sigma-70 factor (ECF subfamily)
MAPTSTDSSESRRLINRIRDGSDTAAMDRLFERHRASLKRVIHLRIDPRLRPRVDPDDIVQETHLEAVRRFPAYLDRPALPFRLWLRQIACDRLLMSRRHHVAAVRRSVERNVPLPERFSVQLAQQMFAREPHHADQIDRRDLARRVRDAVTKLPDRNREILLMRNFEELSTGEVACVLELDPSTVRKRHGQALMRMPKRLIESGLRESEL